jgi:uncharacterized membrane protein
MQMPVKTYIETVTKVQLLVKTQNHRFLLVNAIFALVAIVIEQVGLSLRMYVYADTSLHVLGVPLIVIVIWVIIGHTSWVIYRKCGWIAGFLTGVIIDVPLEFLAFHLGWWTWIPSWTPAIFFNAPVVNFLVYLSVSVGSILIYKYVMEPEMRKEELTTGAEARFRC